MSRMGRRQIEGFPPGRWLVATLVVLAFFGPGAHAVAGTRDDTSALQAKLDAGGSVFLPKLPGGGGYATRGLWVSRGDTTITSDGACVVALGLGPARLGPPPPPAAHASTPC